MIRWPFRRRPRPAPPPPERPPLGESWRAGDMAECIRADWRLWPLVARRPRVGDRALVLAVFPGITPEGRLTWGLQLLGYPAYWEAAAFRKLVLGECAADRRVTRKTPAARTRRQRESIP